jgi:F-type H+-transporting ATPase subunit b
MSGILDIFGVDWRLLVVQAFNFGLLLIALYFILYRPVLALIAKRQALIAQGVQDAQAASEELARITFEKEAILGAAVKDAEEAIRRAKERALSKEETMLREAQEKGERVLREAQEKALEEKRRAIAGAQEEIARMVVLGAEKILREKNK